MRGALADLATAAAKVRLGRWMFLVSVLAAVLALGTGQDPSEAQEAPAPVSAEGADPGEVLVKFEPGTPDATIRSVNSQNGDAQVQDTVSGIGVQLVAVAPGEEQAAVDAYEQDPNVVFAEVNGRYAAADHGSPADPEVGRQWPLDNTGQTGGTKNADVYAFGALHKAPDGGAAPIAVLDSGINQAHPDLQGKVALEANFSSSDTTDDVYGHGTHVAGSAAASTGNGVGIAGTCGDCPLYNVKVLNDTGSGEWSGVADGIVWASDNGAKVINMSLSGPRPSSAVQLAIDYAWNRGVVVVAAAGNSRSQTQQYPAAHSNVISVAATDHDDKLAPFSNYGSKWVDVAAPGVAILSTAKDGGYGLMDGTSSAAPHVAGIAGLVWNSSPAGVTNQEVQDKVEGTTNRIVGTGLYWSKGRVNACRATAGTCDRDKTAPAISGKTPAAGTSGVPVDQNIAAELSEPLDPSTVTNDSLVLVEDGKSTPVPATVSYDTAKMRVVLDPTADLSPNTPYIATVKGGLDRLKDEYGNALPADESWGFATADLSAPGAPSIDLSAASDTGASSTDKVTKNATPAFLGKAEAGSTVKLYEGLDLRGTATASDAGDWSIASASLRDGAHFLSATATDAAGNTSPASASLQVIVDTAAPETNITSSPSGTVTNTTATFYFAPTEAGSSTECKLDGAVFGSCFSPKQYTGLANGAHTFQVTSTDTAGNTDATPAVRTWSVDTAAPAITNPYPSNGGRTSDATPTVQATVRDAQTDLQKANIKFYFRREGTTFVERTGFTYDVATDRLRWTPANPLARGYWYNARVIATDAQGLRTTYTWRFWINR